MNKLIVAKKEALDYNEHYNREKELINNRIKKDKIERRKEAKRRKSRAKLRFLGIVVLMFLVCMFILYRYSQITHLSYEVDNLQKEVTELNREKEDLKLELDSLKNVARIEKDAKLKLGMNYPTEDQIVYLNVNDAFEEKNVAKSTEFNIIKHIKNVVNMVYNFF